MIISLKKNQHEFIDYYMKKHNLNNQSEVVSIALHALQQLKLESEYAHANNEIDEDLDNTSLDGMNK